MSQRIRYSLDLTGGSLNLSGNLNVTGNMNGSFDYSNLSSVPSAVSKATQLHAVYIASTWATRTSAVDNGWISVVWAPELALFVAVAYTGSGNRVMTSPDGVNWTARSSAADNEWMSVTWSPQLSLFVAVARTGTGNRVMTSPDGINWTARSSVANNQWISVVWAPELALFVAVANTGTGNRVMTSPDGITWTSRTSPVDNEWYSVTWAAELSLFVAVSTSGSGNRVMTSPDGITWTSRSSAADNAWHSVCWSPELSLFVAVAYTGSGNRVMTSPDGINWTSRSSAADNSWLSVCWAAELSLFVAVSTSGSGNRVMTSPDGITWTTRSSAADNNWYGVCWAPELCRFVAVAISGSGNRVMTTLIGLPALTADNAIYGTNNNLVLDTSGNLSAPSNTNTVGSLFTTGGNVGIDTVSPAAKLHVNGDLLFTSASASNLSLSGNLNVAGTSNTLGSLFTNTAGNVGIEMTTPRGIFDINSSSNVYLSGNTISGSQQSIYMNGHVYLIPYNNSDISYLQARRSNDSGSTELQLRTYNSGSLVDAIRIKSNGNVGVGTNNPSMKLHVYNNSSGDEDLISLNNNSMEIRLGIVTGSYGGLSGGLRVHRPNVFWVAINSHGVFNLSDKRLKKNIEYRNNELDKILQLNLVSYQLKTMGDDSTKNYGFIAQDVEDIYPEFVSNAEFENQYTNSNDVKVLGYERFGPLAIQGIKELYTQLQQEKQAHQETENELLTLKTFLQSEFPNEIE
jgi:hypothetical protein